MDGTGYAIVFEVEGDGMSAAPKVLLGIACVVVGVVLHPSRAGTFNSASGTIGFVLLVLGFGIVGWGLHDAI